MNTRTMVVGLVWGGVLGAGRYGQGVTATRSLATWDVPRQPSPAR